MAITPTKTIFLESILTGTQRHTSEWIASDIERIMVKNSKSIFAGIITVNTSANKKAWYLLEEKFQTSYF